MAQEKLTIQQVRVLLALAAGEDPSAVVKNYQYTTGRSLKIRGLAELRGYKKSGPFYLTPQGQQLATRYCDRHLKLDCQECSK